ncbi:hypothetical protein SELMODRAFT_270336 [Selaginella moellendorffii]|uniref:RING-type domain-containing protein n=1 Tax=Selaginella moellendorffii TaxID=88036 RepID=D8QVX8_SELML|nr:zinc finger protein-like 1 homolog [Selaginella moellendorffii]EFJ36534.1 hypothetical protein SELMODRAFT_270336 [Selaginella moellendorffii]|eukprot:XP_002963071.1 zinc finger protein-like 1 homolog [Selaginella moellendorffii]
MVVCACRKATRIYCYCHSLALCGECVCADQHKICVVRTYPEWVIDPDYSWPPKCSVCDEELREDQAVSRLGCLHALHSSCLESHLKSFPDHTAPAGYGCPECGLPLWPPPPKNFRNFNVGLPLKLREAIAQAGLAGTLLGGDLTNPDAAPAAFSSMPLVSTIGIPEKSALEGHQPVSTVSEISAVDEPSSTAPVASTSANTSPSPNVSSQMANSLARKNSYRPEKVVIGSMPYIDDDGDDEDAISRKYARRGPFYKQLLTHILPFWSPTLPTLPVTNPNLRKDGDEDRGELHSRRRHHRHSTVDPRNILFVFAILSCIATMLLLYYRLIQNSSLATTS